eukprot:Nitzschia sp. Nitz4//scaffold43_size134323//34206//36244//NITZ4_003287-RA/size134323-augustus-gene-0.218-mRNA-1//1//CDS//3329551912//4946//frame0
MWRRVVTTVARTQPRCLNSRLLAASQTFQPLSVQSTRTFARKVRGDLGDPDEEFLEYEAANKEKKLSKNLSASEMEFYTQLEDEFDDDEDEDEEAKANAEYRRKQQEIHRELDSRTGRGWTDPWEITQEQWTTSQTIDDLPDWSPEFVSRISQERVQVYPEGIPTLAALATMPLPPSDIPHPGLGQAKQYASYRKSLHYKYISEKVNDMVKPQLERILKLKTWEEKQDAVDELFESVEDKLRSQEEILGAHPEFGAWVEQAVEACLSKAQGGAEEAVMKTDRKSMDAEAKPVFMDCYSADDGDAMVPAILRPLKPHPKDGPGRMVEEWQLSAHKKTKRILLRQSTRAIAETLEANASSRIFVHGQRGTGKSAVLSSVVASARKSGYLVMYLPDGDRLRKNGFFVTPNTHREGMFDLQDLSQEACAAFLANHEEDLKGMEASKETMDQYFKETQLARFEEYGGDKVELVEVLKHAADRKQSAPMCYLVVVETLMNQSEKPFLMVLDEFNCFFDKGHYFHMAYDEEVREPIPYSQINLFEHALAAMSISEEESSPKKIARGGIIVATTESHAVPRKVTAALTERASEQNEGVCMVEVPCFSDLEVDHVVANFEAIGVGTLRLDRGDTVMDEHEVAYLKMISGSVGQKLLDSTMVP